MLENKKNRYVMEMLVGAKSARYMFVVLRSED